MAARKSIHFYYWHKEDGSVMNHNRQRRVGYDSSVALMSAFRIKREGSRYMVGNPDAAQLTADCYLWLGSSDDEFTPSPLMGGEGVSGLAIGWTTN
jgi:hypothetical protein